MSEGLVDACMAEPQFAVGCVDSDLHKRESEAEPGPLPHIAAVSPKHVLKVMVRRMGWWPFSSHWAMSCSASRGRSCSLDLPSPQFH